MYNTIDHIKNSGYKVTQPRLAVAMLLSNHPTDDHQGPLSIQDIWEDLERKQIKIDVVSIYRTLELFIRLGIVQEVEFGEGKKRYELRTEHHHHVICESCGKVEEIGLPLEEDIVSKISKKSRFTITKHTMEFFGVCSKCHKGGL